MSINEKPRLSVVVPFYNEEKNVPLVLERFVEIVQTFPLQLVAVNDGSKDGTGSALRELCAHEHYSFVTLVDYEKNKGYGGAILEGLKHAKGEIVGWTHADLQTDPVDVVRGYEELQKYDMTKTILKGKRTKRSFDAWAFTVGMSCIASVLLRIPLWDINAQPKLFHRSFLEKLENAPTDFSLDLFFLTVAKKAGYRIVTIPIFFKPRLHGESKWAFSFSSRWKTIFRTIKYMKALQRKSD